MALTSWVESANGAKIDFPIQSLLYGVFSAVDRGQRSSSWPGEVRSR